MKIDPEGDPSTSQQHRAASPNSLGIGVITVSDTRTMENDAGGALVAQLMSQAGHRIVDRRIVRDEQTEIQKAVRQMLDRSDSDAVLLTGGTGVSKRDCTPEAIQPLIEVELPGYGEIFRQLSYDEIGPAAMLSRASGGRIGDKIILTMPGSPAGVRLALERLIIPELAHLVHHARK